MSTTIFVSAAIVAACGLGVVLINKWESRSKRARTDENEQEQTETSEKRTMKVKMKDIDAFIKEHNLSLLCRTEDEMAAESEAFLKGEECIEVPNNYFELLLNRDSKIKARDSEYSEISSHRVAGMEHEANGDIDEAISEYAESIRLGENAENDMFHAFGHSYTRIIVLLDKVKRYAEEIDYIEALLNRNIKEPERDKYIARLEKTKVKLEKQSKNGRI